MVVSLPTRNTVTSSMCASKATVRTSSAPKPPVVNTIFGGTMPRNDASIRVCYNAAKAFSAATLNQLKFNPWIVKLTRLSAAVATPAIQAAAQVVTQAVAQVVIQAAAAAAVEAATQVEAATAIQVEAATVTQAAVAIATQAAAAAAAATTTTIMANRSHNTQFKLNFCFLYYYYILLFLFKSNVIIKSRAII